MAAKKGVVVTEDGKEYKTVAARVAEFRETHPIDKGWGIRTQVIECSERQVLCTAQITDPENRVVASGSAQEVWDSGQFNPTSALEIAETSAIGRALAIGGFIGVELQICSADEIEQAKKAQRAGKTNKPKAAKAAKAEATEVVAVAATFDEGAIGRLHESIKTLAKVTDLAQLETECNAAATTLRQLRSVTPADKQDQLKPLVDLLVEYKRKIDAGRSA